MSMTIPKLDGVQTGQYTTANPAVGRGEETTISAPVEPAVYNPSASDVASAQHILLASASTTTGTQNVTIGDTFSLVNSGLLCAKKGTGIIVFGSTKADYKGVGFKVDYDPGTFSKIQLTIKKAADNKPGGIVDFQIKLGESDGPSVSVEELDKNGVVTVELPVGSYLLGPQDKLQLMFGKAGTAVNMQITDIKFIK